MRAAAIFLFATILVLATITAGFDLLSRNKSVGLTMAFVGICTAIGLTIDIVKHVRTTRKTIR